MIYIDKINNFDSMLIVELILFTQGIVKNGAYVQFNNSQLKFKFVKLIAIGTVFNTSGRIIRL